MKFEVTILGNNSAFPAQGRFPSAQVVNHNEELFLIDCGEGTQIRMSEFGIKRMRINHILISHLHGDHVFGLPGLINSYQHLNRHDPLHIYGPVGLRQMTETVLRISRSMIQFELVFHELQTSEKTKVIENRSLRIYAFPLRHRVPTYGYVFVERPGERNIRKSAIADYNLTYGEIKQLKDGQDIMRPDGELIASEKALLPASRLRSFAYCSDTIFDKTLIPWIENVTLLYHEATFLHELEQKARESMHSTALQAGTIAHLANAEMLLIGHFSSRYSELNELVDEAREIFLNTEVAVEGHTYPIGPGAQDMTIE